MGLEDKIGEGLKKVEKKLGLDPVAEKSEEQVISKPAVEKTPAATMVEAGKTEAAPVQSTETKAGDSAREAVGMAAPGGNTESLDASTPKDLKEKAGHSADVPETEPCNPCTDLITAAKRVLRDPKVNRGIGDWLLEAAQSDSSKKKTQDRLAHAKEAALTSLANAVAGRDAVPAKGEPCRGQLRLFVEFLDPLNAGQTLSQAFEAAAKRFQNSSTNGMQRDVKRLELNREIARQLNFQLLDDQLRVAAEGGRTYDEQGGILISQVEAGTVFVSLLANIFGGAEFIADFLATEPGGDTYTHYTGVPPSVAPIITLDPLIGTAYPGYQYDETLVVTGGVPPYKFSIANGTTSVLQQQLNLSLDGSTGRISGTPQPSAGPKQGTPFPFTAQVEDSMGNTATANCTITYEGQYPQQTGLINAAKNPAPASKTNLAPPSPKQVPGRMLSIGAGLETRAVLFLRPPAAHVRCFSLTEGDDCCGQGKQYISRVAISAMQGDNFVDCRPTGASGCSGFTLNPGMYIFSAPRDITIEGCNYTLASSSPISAFLGAGQSCSDIYFCYKKKGSEIQVISEIISALGGDPYVPAKENFPGMEYLLLSESDPTFVPQQQTTTDGGALSFRNLAAGTYQLFCQAPALYGAQPVTPVYPTDGRLSLRVFAGQTSRVPVLVKFRTCTTAPAVLEGYVRDDTGAPIPQQVVQVLNDADCLVAAGLTDATGFYSIQIYFADNVTLVVGTQQIAVSKSQIQAAMKAVGTPPLPSPGATLNLATQASELVQY